MVLLDDLSDTTKLDLCLIGICSKSDHYYFIAFERQNDLG